MSAVTYYSILGTFICTGILLGTTFLIVLDIVDEIGEFRTEVEEDLNQFKVYTCLIESIRTHTCDENNYLYRPTPTMLGKQ